MARSGVAFAEGMTHVLLKFVLSEEVRHGNFDHHTRRKRERERERERKSMIFLCVWYANHLVVSYSSC